MWWWSGLGPGRLVSYALGDVAFHRVDPLGPREYRGVILGERGGSLTAFETEESMV